MDLVRDLLDKQVVDRNRIKMGKVDGIVLEVRPDHPPRVLWIEIGAPTLWARLHPRLGRWMAALARRFGPELDEPVRIPFTELREAGVDIELDVTAGRVGAMRWETWCREHVVRWIPGARH